MLPREYCEERLRLVSPETLASMGRDDLQLLALCSYVVAADLTPSTFTSELSQLAEGPESPRLARAARQMLREWHGGQSGAAPGTVPSLVTPPLA